MPQQSQIVIAFKQLPGHVVVMFYLNVYQISNTLSCSLAGSYSRVRVQRILQFENVRPNTSERRIQPCQCKKTTKPPPRGRKFLVPSCKPNLHHQSHSGDETKTISIGLPPRPGSVYLPETCKYSGRSKEGTNTWFDKGVRSGLAIKMEGKRMRRVYKYLEKR